MSRYDVDADALIFARDHGIRLFVIPPHASMLYQPMDKLFIHLHAAYAAAATTWRKANKEQPRMSRKDIVRRD